MKTYSYDYKYNRVYGIVERQDTKTRTTKDIFFLQGEAAHRLAEELEQATNEQKQLILSGYDYEDGFDHQGSSSLPNINHPAPYAIIVAADADRTHYFDSRQDVEDFARGLLVSDDESRISSSDFKIYEKVSYWGGCPLYSGALGVLICAEIGRTTFCPVMPFQPFSAFAW
jgi:hypothetical protein